MISIRRISLGGGFRYLMESVAAGDDAAERSGGLARYYASSGTPPCAWVGSCLADLGDGIGIPGGEVVAESSLRAMLGELADPVSGVSRAGARNVPGSRLPVAGFDLTFSPPKSVSVAWALADEGTKAVIYACHREAEVGVQRRRTAAVRLTDGCGYCRPALSGSWMVPCGWRPG